MTDNSRDKQKWNSRYSSISDASEKDIDMLQPSKVLLENAYLLPASGSALDLACGLGANALFLDRQSLETYAWDISDVAIEHLRKVIISSSLNIKLETRDVVARPPQKNSFDVIVVSHFLDRTLTTPLIEALTPGGLLFYQTFTVEKIPGIGPSNPDYLLQPNELLELFKGLRIRVYREEGMEGDLTQGFRNEAMLVAQKVT